ncbi:MAG: uracil permease [Firmicutes bacterium]|nr:uracil permease [Bacillota bacterium]
MSLLTTLFPGSKEYEPNSLGKTWTLGLQHAFAMSCATILVPLLTGLDVGVALFAAGAGTLLFHIITRGKMPTFLGSSFSFISALCGIIGNDAFGASKAEQISAAMGGIIIAGLIYVIISFVIRGFGSKFIDRVFPPVVRGVGIAIIGLNLSVSAINNIQANNGFEMFSSGYVWSWCLAIFVCILAVCLSSYGKGMVKMASIFLALVIGYVVTLILVKTGLAPQGLMDFGGLAEQGRGLARAVFEVPQFTFPTFNGRAIAMIAPIAIVTCVEHIGDVYANSAVVGKDFVKDPGLHRTMLGDGLATILAGFIGGPSNTTYSENTAVLATTGNYNPSAIRAAAVIAIVVSFIGKAIGAIETMPNCVLGGTCIVLYGMIASVGLRTLVENHVDFTKNRNLSIAAIMLVLAIGGATIGGPDFSFSGIGLGIIAGIILNAVLPLKTPEDEEKLVSHTVPENEIIEERHDNY